MVSEFTANVVMIIGSIPRGKVLPYGRIALLAGKPRGARQVVRVLYSRGKKHDLPWHRVVNSRGGISIRDPVWAKEQRFRLEAEGVVFSDDGRIDMDRFCWDVTCLRDITAGEKTK